MATTLQVSSIFTKVEGIGTQEFWSNRLHFVNDRPIELLNFLLSLVIKLLGNLLKPLDEWGDTLPAERGFLPKWDVPRILEERKLRTKKAEDASKFFLLLHSQIMTLLTRANEIDHQLTDEHGTYFNTSVRELTNRVGERRKFNWIRQAEKHLSNYTTHKLKFSTYHRLVVDILATI